MHSKKVALVYGSLLAILAIAGACGKTQPAREANRSLATGVVTLDGKALPGGNVTIISAKNSMYRTTATIGAGGVFTIRDAPTGDVLIAVETDTIRVFNPKCYVAIPVKYADAKTSGLTANILKDTPEGTKLTFELKSK